jgi:hypothetical protein
MSQHKFKLGQAVDYLANHRGVPASLKAYTIIGLLPSDGNDLQYRIKSAGETFERIVKERDLGRRRNAA